MILDADTGDHGALSAPATTPRWKKALVMVTLVLMWLALGTVAATMVGMATGLIQGGSD